MERNTLRSCAFLAAALAVLASCSSAPKPPNGVFSGRNESARLADLGAKSAREGHRSESVRFYQEAYRLATAADDPASRLACLDGLAVLYAAAAPESASVSGSDGAPAPDALPWGKAPDSPAECRALAASIAAESADPVLLARSTLLDAEAGLAELAKAASPAADDYAKLAAAAGSAAAALGGRPADKARAFRVLAQARRGGGDAAGALAALDDAAALDRKQKRFVELAADRYAAAAIHSKAGNAAAAKAALLEALASDRQAENAAGIGSDYRALALVAEKAGDRASALAYYASAREVFAAGRYAAEAADCERRRAALAASGAPAAAPAAALN